LHRFHEYFAVGAESVAHTFQRLRHGFRNLRGKATEEQRHAGVVVGGSDDARRFYNSTSICTPDRFTIVAQLSERAGRGIPIEGEAECLAIAVIAGPGASVAEDEFPNGGRA
jgi:hypothetical protein